MTSQKKVQSLLKEIRACTFCPDLPLGPRPIIQFSVTSKILIVGQAPGTAVHASGIPWDDPSGDRLRDWMGVTKEKFYDEKNVAIVPMGFCYPGKGKTGDLPPRKECAELWHEKVLNSLSDVKLALLVGQYAQKYFLDDLRKKTLTETVRHWEDYLPKFLPLPHPSPRNNIWLKKNQWFEAEVIPFVRKTCTKHFS